MTRASCLSRNMIVLARSSEGIEGQATILPSYTILYFWRRGTQASAVSVFFTGSLMTVARIEGSALFKDTHNMSGCNQDNSLIVSSVRSPPFVVIQKTEVVSDSRTSLNISRKWG